jgi:site-specific DNA-methyltransferase (adenine-specific)
MSVEKNTLWYGDNLEVMRKHIKDESVDLIYLDPPFNSKANYNILYKEPSGERSQSQIQAFTDTWHWDAEAEKNYRYLIENSAVPQEVTQLIKALHDLLGTNDMCAYLVMMAVRLLEFHRVLKNTGSIYLHCDSTASHYLKLLMDSVFKLTNFRNEIVWCYTGPSASKSGFPRKHDIILRYTKTDVFTFNPDAIRVPYKKSLDAAKSRTGIYAGKEYENLDDKFEKYDIKGKIPEDWWADITPVGRIKNELLGYPTQKPVALLKRIILASSNEGDVVLDPFCGCGTAVDASQELKRKWIGIDITYLSINVIVNRMKQRYPDLNIDIKGMPEDLESAKFLAKQNKTQFEYWALSMVGARPRKPDLGVDGVRYIYNENGKETCAVVVQVKGGAINNGMIRDFAHTITKENAYAGIFITLEEPTTGARAEATSLGFAKEPDDLEYCLGTEEPIPRFQIITLEELMKGKRPRLPYKNVTLDR